MEVRLISEITVRLVQKMGGDSMVVAAAKVSTSGEEAASFVDKEANYGLISYLMKHRHGTPFEHSAMTFFVHAPIFVWREWHRHRIGFAYDEYGANGDPGVGMSFNEESGRYKQLDPVFYVPPQDRPMMKVEGWKPGRPKFSLCKDEETYARLCGNLRHSYLVAYQSYQRNLDLGIDPGLARDCLPVGIYSSCWVTCNPRSVMAFLSLRTHEAKAKFVSYPLFEIEEAARKVEKLFAEGWPLTYRAFVENGRVGP